MKDAAYWIRTLGLEKHPEGGFFRETYRAGESIPAASLPERFRGARAFSTAIYFLLPAGQFSAFHLLAADEVWHFYGGRSLTLVTLSPDGELARFRLGPRPDRSEVHQAAVAAGSWLAATLNSRTGYTLVGCTVAPGFEFVDFQLGSRRELLALFPQHAPLIRRFTAPGGKAGGDPKKKLRRR